VTRLIIVLVASYLLGSLPTSALVARGYGVDIRREGSGNPGATNVLRVIGWKPALLVLLVDVAKGFVAAYWIGGLAAGAAAVLGHVWPVFSGFRGGKGVATAGGVLLAVDPLAFGIAITTFSVVVATTRLVSLASIGSAILIPIILAALRILGVREVPGPLLVFTAALALLVVFTHRGNITQLIAGTESRIGRPR